MRKIRFGNFFNIVFSSFFRNFAQMSYLSDLKGIVIF
jgi:hypothetical protein